MWWEKEGPEQERFWQGQCSGLTCIRKQKEAAAAGSSSTKTCQLSKRTTLQQVRS
jgi:hypothetical protein